jgi:hypothetical protein
VKLKDAIPAVGEKELDQPVAPFKHYVRQCQSVARPTRFKHDGRLISADDLALVAGHEPASMIEFADSTNLKFQISNLKQS